MIEDFFTTFYYQEQTLPKRINLFQNATMLICGV